MTLKDYYQQIDSTKEDSYYFQERKIKRDIVLSFKYFFKKKYLTLVMLKKTVRVIFKKQIQKNLQSIKNC